jgi:hypothetical protein
MSEQPKAPKWALRDYGSILRDGESVAALSMLRREREVVEALVADANLGAACDDLLAELRRLEAELTGMAADLSHSDDTREWADSRARSASAVIRRAEHLRRGVELEREP